MAESGSGPRIITLMLSAPTAVKSFLYRHVMFLGLTVTPFGTALLTCATGLLLDMYFMAD
eukprot:CAMPEP_0178662914 /NCGR_PEP_ID=MMETSP0698-20121128/28524_1 /TAXON_ID=265572 /ORGANISM="Extubocellulus spinifer, Strain CCMP396" /LENGTH=59 /DNA_ID=CAMNT_0020305893 /DNA_START=56 /DNA_END=232 /DNA_ORIENTATION=-